jgi:hypothetical protein
LGSSLQNINIEKHDMASEITSLLKRGWENLWKNRILWLFSGLALIASILRLIIPNQKSDDLTSSFLGLIISLASFYFTVVGDAGISVVAYCIAIGNPVDFETAFQASRNLFWRIVGLTFLLILCVAPFACVLVFAFWRFTQIKDIPHDIYLAVIPLSIFSALGSFTITEMIANNSTIGNSLKSAWTVFTDHFVNLAVIGLLLIGVSRVVDIFIGMAILLVQNNSDVSALSNLDFIYPHFSFPNGSFFGLVTAITQKVWQTYGTSIFTVAYVKYRGAKRNKQIQS